MGAAPAAADSTPTTGDGRYGAGAAGRASRRRAAGRAAPAKAPRRTSPGPHDPRARHPGQHARAGRRQLDATPRAARATELKTIRQIAGKYAHRTMGSLKIGGPGGRSEEERPRRRRDRAPHLRHSAGNRAI